MVHQRYSRALCSVDALNVDRKRAPLPPVQREDHLLSRQVVHQRCRAKYQAFRVERQPAK